MEHSELSGCAQSYPWKTQTDGAGETPLSCDDAVPAITVVQHSVELVESTEAEATAVAGADDEPPACFRFCLRFPLSSGVTAVLGLCW